MAVRSKPRKIVKETLSQKYPTKNRADGVAYVVEHLSSKCEALRPEFKPHYCQRKNR
jgi:hypothetical protein